LSFWILETGINEEINLTTFLNKNVSIFSLTSGYIVFCCLGFVLAVPFSNLQIAEFSNYISGIKPSISVADREPRPLYP
jgi:hypothetical protein